MKMPTEKLPGKNDKNVAQTSKSRQLAAPPAAPDDGVKQDGNHSQPLQKDAIRKAATAEQTKLQRDPDSLPAPGFPNKRDPSSAAKNNEDPVLPNQPRDK
jgi:hypothetical protein